MTKDEVRDIMVKSSGTWTGDNAFKGLKILSKYTDYLIQAAEHDIIYSEEITKLIDAGITKKDLERLRKLNWLVDEEHLACYV